MRFKKTIQKEVQKVQAMYAVASVICIESVIRVLTENIQEEDLVSRLELEYDGTDNEVKLDEALRIAEHTRNWMDCQESRSPSEELLLWHEQNKRLMRGV